jgi:hypothetical protein
MCPQTVEQAIKAFGANTVLFRTFDPGITHHVNVGSCAEVSTCTSKDQYSKILGAVMVA